MQEAAVAVALAPARREEFRFGSLRLREREFRCDCEESVEFGIEALDSPEHQLGELDGRELAFSKKFPDLFDGGERKIGVIHA